MKNLWKFIWDIFKHKIPIPYLIMVLVIATVRIMLSFPEVKEYLYGPGWTWKYDSKAETMSFETDTILRGGEITVRTQLEFKYEDKIFYILEIQGLFDINRVGIDKVGGDDENEKTKFCLAISPGQRDVLDAFKQEMEKVLEESLKKEYGDDFEIQKLEVIEREIVESSYQSTHMNRSQTMYLSASEEEISTIKASEVVMRSADTVINLDEINLDESFYTDEKIIEITEVCAQRISTD